MISAEDCYKCFFAEELTQRIVQKDISWVNFGLFTMRLISRESFHIENAENEGKPRDFMHDDQRI